MNRKLILHVEDNAHLRWLVTEILEFEGYEVVGTENGLEGVALAHDGHPHLILMDIQLPGISGLEAASRIKSAPELATVPIIAVTAGSDQSQRDHFLSSGFAACLFKPFDAADLLSLVHQFIGQSEVDASSAAESG